MVLTLKNVTVFLTGSVGHVDACPFYNVNLTYEIGIINFNNLKNQPLKIERVGFLQLNVEVL
ncbi:hypothetical protein C7J88_01455 [Staphylococcus muscae]|uniref:Uncharacterized protein n=1 Tax=Staphylococcus muscae TaxID=1294 RepID=A0A240C2C7_9STAP|nr:hypothetical protein C7J88_01455 [Staphylococcus muscae]GGA79947.1 hypothetical protein GCM10007183_00120 [Staphylococcus muscae]SNW02080.1 Uncharacterised protein [Staphylococcus muscae]